MLYVTLDLYMLSSLLCTSSFTHFSYCPRIHLHEQSSTCSSLTVQWSIKLSLHCRHRYASEVSPPSPQLRESGVIAYLSTLTHQQPYAVASLVNTRLAWPVLVSQTSPLPSASAVAPALSAVAGSAACVCFR